MLEFHDFDRANDFGRSLTKKQIIILGACYVVAAVLLLLLAACDKAEEEQRLEYTVEALPDPDQYQVKLFWKADAFASGWVVKRSEKAEVPPSDIATLSASQLAFSDPKVEAGKNYLYTLVMLSEDEPSGPYKVEVSIPKDLEVRNSVFLHGELIFQRLFLRPQGRIETRGEPILLRLTELVSDNGMIDSSPAAHSIQPGSNGLSAGQITVLARTARGAMRIAGNGDAGLAGLDGRDGQPGAIGPRGTPGQSFGFPFIKACMRHPGNGGRGYTGHDGADGMNGGSGGNSAKVYVEIATPSDFTSAIEANVGKGGLGGHGGKGGRGGLGGPPGFMDPHGACSPARVGPEGVGGMSGKSGLNGSNGTKLPVCVKNGNETTGACNAF